MSLTCGCFAVLLGLVHFDFDFGTPNSPLAESHAQVTYETGYEPQTGYGWLVGKVQGMDRGVGSDTTRDLNATRQGVFAVDVPPGEYDLTITMGDAQQARPHMSVILDGAVVDTLSTAQGQFVQRTYRTVVSTGRLLMLVLASFSGDKSHVVAINALRVAPAGSPIAPMPEPEPEMKPIPELALWEENMIRYGRQRADWLEANRESALGATYYDAARVFYQIADYTDDPTWLLAAEDAIYAYRDLYVLRHNGSVPAYWCFAQGLAEDYYRTGDELSREAVILLSRRATFASDLTPLEWSESYRRSREVAFNITAQLEAEALGVPRRLRTELLTEQAFGHLDQWTVSRTALYVRPFMVGLTCEALIAHEAATGDERVLPAIATALDWIWENCWLEEDEAFQYTDIDTRTLPTTHPDYSTGGTTPAPDLNLLIAPAFAWVYHQTGDETFRDRGDLIFAGGVKKAWLSPSKQFNQNYRWSFKYVEWRSKPPLTSENDD